jgi:4-hydroxy-tetrahydrodipicolinate synthase
MKTLDLGGIFVPIATPYTEDEALDEAALRRLTRHLLPDVSGFIVNGTTGDFPLLTREERRRSVEIIVEEVDGAKPVLAGTGAPSTHEAITLSEDAQAAGADGLMVVTPYYLRPSPQGLARHFAEVAAAVPELPMLLYNFPQLVGQSIPAPVVAALYQDVPNLVGMKDTSGDLVYMLNVLSAVDGDFQMLAGRAVVVVPALASGAVGAILADANLIPARWQEVYTAARQGDWETARAGQYHLQALGRLIGKGGSLTVRAGLALLDVPIGPPRRPLTPEGVLTTEDLEQLQALLEV